MRNLILTIVFLLVQHISFGQDIIKFTNSEQQSCKVIEITESHIKYKKSENLEGPVYTVSISEVENITYKNGMIENYSKLNVGDLNELFYKLTKRKNKVFVDANDANAIIHATNELKKWGYWGIVKDKKDADFILFFNLTNALDFFGNARFINPENDEIIKQTENANTLANMDLNPKRGVVKKIVRKRIKPLYKNI
ncbi:hypothetical protein [Flammeovirga sp. SJP92]|uniref:hypothetical protein n=1 Tax=Flammeovirga sp. SJP92 TaxID=1775430 RepID=UPI0007883445|nr:hypothetical protein [Flammeovirga sp. SJP92]KXX67124.1 hypothetical protein AVL50_27435 [Flammeovirga sp. SJP92]